MIKVVSALTKGQKKDIWNLIEVADHEFVPPLSVRDNTTQTGLTKGVVKKTPEEYFNALIMQSFILCIKNNHVVGFLSFIPDHTLSMDECMSVVCDYVSTIVVSPKFRGRNITISMYKTLFAFRPEKIYATRTWSLNYAHISILCKLGFHLALQLKDDRGPGIDTVYYLRGNSNE